ncbi:MAG: protein phosphatase 2C domain-containing protein [Azoarcus sp.]|jgi:serine/threonine protein phosphatase PrpC|nr:protein phosphatase 2C domain-containing protein [Azoarcus sp.]
MRLTVETCIARHIGDRKEQQDRVEILAHKRAPGTLLAVLADGMGGHSGGAMAAEQVLLSARQNLDVFSPGSEQPRVLLDGVMRDAHSSIRLTRFTSEKDPHSTAVVFLLCQGRAFWAHCGDSRLYHFRGRETLLRSQDHSLVGELLRRGRLTEEESLQHPQRNVLIACLGSERQPRPEYGSCGSLSIGDNFLLCSDGLWAYFPNDELAQILSGASSRDAAQQLVDLARERACGEGDNLSLAIIKCIAAAD